MSLEMAHKVIVPQKKIMSSSFLNSGTSIVIFLNSNKKKWGFYTGFYHKLMIVIFDLIITSIRNDRFAYVEVVGM